MNCIIYSRVSTLTQENARQVSELTGYARYKEYKILSVFEEKVSGASKAKGRVEFKKLFEFVEQNKVNHILVWELSRLGRSMLDVLNTIESLSGMGINIYSKKEGINTLENGKMSGMTKIIISVLSGFAEMERETIKQRSISGIRKNVQDGGSGTGIIKPYGYEKVQKKLVVNKEEAGIVKLIFQKYLTGLGTGQIASYLNDKQIPTRYNKLFPDKHIKQKYGVLKSGSSYTWKDGTIYAILTNTIYIGQRKHKGEVFKVDPIITQETFEKAQTKLHNKVNKNQSKRTYENPLKDILICGKCGRGYYMHKRADNSDNAYKCISKRYKESCGNPSIGIEKLIDGLYCMYEAIITHPQVEKLFKDSPLVDEAIDNKEIEMANTRKSVVEISRFLDNLARQLVEGKVTAAQHSSLLTEYRNTLDRHEKRLDTISGELEKLYASKEQTTPKGYSKKMFLRYIQASTQSIKIFGVPNMKPLRKAFPSEQDVAVLIQINPAVDLGLHPSLYHFLISQRSNNIALVDFGRTGNIDDKIVTQKYRLYSCTTIEGLRHTLREYLGLEDLLPSGVIMKLEPSLPGRLTKTAGKKRTIEEHVAAWKKSGKKDA